MASVVWVVWVVWVVPCTLWREAHAEGVNGELRDEDDEQGRGRRRVKIGVVGVLFWLPTEEERALLSPQRDSQKA